MKNFRVYYKTTGATYRVTPHKIIRAADAEQALEIFAARFPWSDAVAIFAE